MSDKIEFPYTYEFYNTLDFYAKNRSEAESSLLQIYHHCFKCMLDKDLEGVLVNMHTDFKKEPEYWFYMFHKMVRQVDFFDGVYYIDVNNNLNEDEKKELEKLRERIFAEVERSEEEKARYRVLNSKSRMETRESLGGHIDMILWNMIHVDQKNILKSVFEATFDAVKFKKKKPKAKT